MPRQPIWKTLKWKYYPPELMERVALETLKEMRAEIRSFKPYVETVEGDKIKLSIDTVNIFIDTKQKTACMSLAGRNKKISWGVPEDLAPKAISASKNNDLLDLDFEARLGSTSPESMFYLWAENKNSFLKRLWKYDLTSKVGEIVHAKLRAYRDSKYFLENNISFNAMGDGGKVTSLVKVLASMLKKDFTFKNLPRYRMKAVWDRLDPEVLDITLKANGFSANSYHYSLIGQHLDDCRKLMKVTPSVVTLFCLLKDIGYRLDGSIPNCSMQIESNPVRWVQDCLKRMDLGDKCFWRLLTSLPPLWVNRLLRGPRTDIKHHLLCLMSMGKLRFTVFKAITRDAFERNYYQRAGKQLDVFFFRAAATKAANRSICISEFLAEMRNVYDWFAAESANLDQNQLKAPWSSYKRWSDEWHEEQIKKGTTRNLTWENLVPEHSYKDYVIVPLSTSQELTDEGQAMHHCVSSYDNSCNHGHSRVYSIRRGRKRLATLELSRTRIADGTTGEDKFSWSVGQIQGPCNTVVSKELKRVGTMLCIKYNKAEKKLKEEQQKELVQA